MADLKRDALEAEQLLGNELLQRILSDIERDAVELAISAHLTDHELRASAMAEVRASRSLVAKLKSRIDDARIADKFKGSPV